MAKKEPEVTVDTFTKEQLIASKKFATRKDALKALLADDEAYRKLYERQGDLIWHSAAVLG